MGLNNRGCLPPGNDRSIARRIWRWSAFPLLFAALAACGFPRPADIASDAALPAGDAPSGCVRDPDCSSPTPFCVDTTCVACRDSTSCPSARPVCDLTGHDCRTCAQDSECDSGACDLAAGTCVASNSILYASPAGFTTDPCTQTSPCSLERAAQLVTPDTPYIVLQPGRYSGGADFNGKKATITGSNAIIDIVNDPLSLIMIENGSTITMRNVDIDDHVTNLMVETIGAIVIAQSDVTIENMKSTTTQIRAVGTTNNNVGHILTITRSTFSGPGILGGDNSPGLVIDSCFFRNFSSNQFPISIDITDSIQLTNSVLFSDSMHQTFALNTSNDGSHIAHNTFVGGTGVTCQDTPGRSQIFDSNIFYNVPRISAALSCQFQYNVSVPDAGFTGAGNIGNITGDPMFKDATNGDFHLKPGSAAIDAANPGDVFTGHDFDGTPRPQGPRSDIGAFEYVPPR